MVESEAWPSNSCTARRSPPPASRCVAKEWRSACGVARFGQAQRAAQMLHQGLRLARAHRLAAAGNKQRPVARQRRRKLRGIGVDRLAHHRQHRHAALLAALADDVERRAQRGIAALQAQRLGNAKARAIKQREQRDVAWPRSIHRSALCARPPLPARARHRLRSRAAAGCAECVGCARRARRRCRECPSRARWRKKLRIAASARCTPRGPNPSARRSGDEAADVGGRELGQRALVHRPAQMPLQEGEKARHIVAIGAQRVRAGAALMGEARQPVRLQFLGRSSHARMARSSARAKKERSAALSSLFEAPFACARPERRAPRGASRPISQAEQRQALACAAAGTQQHLAAARKNGAHAVRPEHASTVPGCDQPHALGAGGGGAVLAFHAKGGAVRAQRGCGAASPPRWLPRRCGHRADRAAAVSCRRSASRHARGWISAHRVRPSAPRSRSPVVRSRSAADRARLGRRIAPAAEAPEARRRAPA